LTDPPISAFRIILSTCAGLEEGERIARALVESQIAACATLLPEAHSFYAWEGKVESAREVLLVVKTSAAHVERVQQLIVSLHTYAIPEFLVLEISRGSEAYLQWLAGSLK
jgi:periplasmic divalent cation tolerance protein